MTIDTVEDVVLLLKQLSDPVVDVDYYESPVTRDLQIRVKMFIGGRRHDLAQAFSWELLYTGTPWHLVYKQLVNQIYHYVEEELSKDEEIQGKNEFDHGGTFVTPSPIELHPDQHWFDSYQYSPD